MAAGSVTRDPTAGGKAVGTDVQENVHYQLVHAVPTDRTMVRQYLTQAGDGTGTEKAIADYTTPDEFYIAPAADEVMVITKLHWSIFDASTLSLATYGNLASLTVGCQLLHRQDPATPATITDYFGGKLIKSNADLLKIGTLEAALTGAIAWSGGHMFKIVIDFADAGCSLRLDGGDLDYLSVLLSDNMTGLDSQTFFAEGYFEVEP